MKRTALAIKQFFIKVIALQWIFAFVVFAVFLIEALYLGGARFYGRDSLLRQIREPETDPGPGTATEPDVERGQDGADGHGEREPLLAGSEPARPAQPAQSTRTE